MPNDLYVNIPIKYLNTTTKLLQANNIDTLTGKEMTNLTTVSTPNYFKHKGNLHKPERRIATGCPLPGASWPKSLFC
jgi:hypothetical protein